MPPGCEGSQHRSGAIAAGAREPALVDLRRVPRRSRCLRREPCRSTCCSTRAGRSSAGTARRPDRRSCCRWPRGIPVSLPVTRSWLASPPPDRLGIAVDRWSGPCWRRTTAPPTKRRRTRRSHGKSRSDPRTPLGVLPQPTICKLRSGAGGRHGVVRRSATGQAGFAGPELLLRGGYARRQAVLPTFGNHVERARVPWRMSNLSRPAAAVLLAAVTLAACSGGSRDPRPRRPPRPQAPRGTPRRIPTIAGIAHPTGATDVVLRFDEAGGFVPVEFLAAHVPYFTLYGDGTVVFVQNAPQVDPAPDNIGRGSPLRTGKLTEPQVQDLLEFALGQGGLGIAKADYPNPNVADAPTATFEIHADGGDKTVSVMALGMDGPARARHGDQGVARAARRAPARLRSRRHAHERPVHAGRLSRGAHRRHGQRQGRAAPGRGRRSSSTGSPFPPIRTPCARARARCRPTRSRPSGSRTSRTASRPACSVTGPDQKLYSLVVRPLLPDEKA